MGQLHSTKACLAVGCGARIPGEFESVLPERGEGLHWSSMTVMRVKAARPTMTYHWSKSCAETRTERQVLPDLLPDSTLLSALHVSAD